MGHPVMKLPWPLAWGCAIIILATACTSPAGGWIAPTPAGISDGNGREGGTISTTGPISGMSTLSPTLTTPNTWTGTPTPNPTPIGYVPGTGVESYVVQPGQTLGWIALVFGCTVEEIVAANKLADANSITAGQTLIIPVSATEVGPSLKLVPDSEMVYGPAYINFDLPGFIAAQGGYLAGYTEEVEGNVLKGAEIVQLVSRRFSVGPRVLLALLELRSGWVTDPRPAPETLSYPLGYVKEYHEGLFRQLSWAASSLNEGYYGWKWRRRGTLRLGDGTRVAIAPGLNPGSAGVQNCLAGLSASLEEWQTLVSPSGFSAVYERLFGNPFAYAVEPLVPQTWHSRSCVCRGKPARPGTSPGGRTEVGGTTMTAPRLTLSRVRESWAVLPPPRGLPQPRADWWCAASTASWCSTWMAMASSRADGCCVTCTSTTQAGWRPVHSCSVASVWDAHLAKEDTRPRPISTSPVAIMASGYLRAKAMYR